MEERILDEIKIGEKFKVQLVETDDFQAVVFDTQHGRMTGRAGFKLSGEKVSKLEDVKNMDLYMGDILYRFTYSNKPECFCKGEEDGGDSKEKHN